jgi:chromosome segregation ATPase
MIFKTFDSDKDTFSSKFGILGKSFEDIGNRFKKVSEELIVTNDYTISNIANAWKNSSVKKDLSDKFIITKSDIQDKLKDLSVYEKNPQGILDNLLEQKELVDSNQSSWQKYFEGLAEGEKWQTKFVQTNDLTKVSLDDVKNAQNAAKQSAIAYNNGLKQMIIGVKAGQVALKGLAMAGNMLVSLGISAIISLAIKGLDNLAHAADNAKESSESFSNSFKSMNEEFTSNDSKLSDLQEQYTKLSKGVDTLGRNVSLTTDEYDTYKQVISEISNMMPNLLARYDDEGNKIGFVQGKLKDLSAEYDNYKKKKALDLVTGKNDNGDSVKDVFENYGYQIYHVNAGGTTVGNPKMFGSSNYEKIAQLQAEIDSGYDGVFGKHKLTNEDIEEKTALIQKYQSEIDASVASIRDVISAIGQSGDAYYTLTDQQQQLFDTYVNSLSQDVIDKNQLYSENATRKFVNNLINDIKSDKGQVVEAYTELFTFDVDDTKLNPIEIKEQIDKLVQNLANAIGEEDWADLKIRLGFSFVDDDASNYEKELPKINAAYNSIVNRFKTKVDARDVQQIKNGTQDKPSNEDASKISTFLDMNGISQDLDSLTEFNEVTADITDADEAIQAWTDHVKEAGGEVKGLPTTMAEAWKQLKASTDDSTKGVADALTALADKGELTIKTFSETDGAKNYFDGLSMSAEEAVKYINSLSDKNSQLGQMSKNIQDITGALGTKLSDGIVSVDDFTGFDATIKGLDSWDEFTKLLGDSSSSMAECQEAANKLATEYVNENATLSLLNDSNREYYEAQLSKMGITNATAVVEAALAKNLGEEKVATEEAIKAGLNLNGVKITAENATDLFANATVSEIAELAKEAQQSGVSAQALALLALKKLNNPTLTTDGDIQNLLALCEGLDLATQAIRAYQNIKSSVLDDNGNIKANNSQEAIQKQEALDNSFAAMKNLTKVNIEQKVNTTPSVGGSGSNGGGGGSSSSTKKKTPLEKLQDWLSTLFDWIEVKLERQTDKISKYISKAESQLDDKKYSSSAKNYSNAIDTTNVQVRYEETARDKYYAQANKILNKAVASKVISQKTADIIATRVADGSMNISEYSDEIREVISAYQEWYNKGKDASNALEELHKNIRTYIQDLKDVRDKQRDAKIDSITGYNDIATNTVANSARAKNSQLNASNSSLGKQNATYRDYVQNVTRDTNGVAASANGSVTNAIKGTKDTKYRTALLNAQKAIKNKTAVSDADLSTISAHSTYVYNRLYAYNVALDNAETARMEYATAYSSNYTDAIKNITEKYSNKDDATNDTMDLNSSKSDNAVTAKTKNKYLNKQASGYDTIAKNNQAEIDQYASSVKSARKTMNKSATATAYNGLGSKGQKAVSNVVEKARSQAKSKKPISASLISKITEYYKRGYISRSFYESCIRYNNARESLDQARKQAEIDKQTAITQKAELAQQKFSNISTEIDNKRHKYEQTATELNAKMSLYEERGNGASANWYVRLQKTEQKEYDSLIEKRKKQIKELDDSVANGSIKKGSTEWYDMKSQIDDTTNSINDAKKALAEYNNQILQVRWDRVDEYVSKLQNLTTETDFVINELSRKDLTSDKTGGLTKEGNAVAGLHVSNYKVYQTEAKKYQSEIKKINKQLADDPYNQKLIAHKEELVKSYQDAIAGAQDEKYAVIDLIENGYTSLRNHISDLIDQYNDLISSEKNAYDYANNISDKTQQIANIRKQLQAYSGDVSEEARAKVQELNVSLKDAEKDLKDTQFDQYVSATQDMLSDFQDDLDESIQNIIDTLDDKFKGLIDTINENWSSDNNVINKTLSTIGYSATKDGLKMYANGDITKNTTDAVNGVRIFLEKAWAKYDKTAHDSQTTSEKEKELKQKQEQIDALNQQIKALKEEKVTSKAQKQDVANRIKNLQDQIKELEGNKSGNSSGGTSAYGGGNGSENKSTSKTTSSGTDAGKKLSKSRVREIQNFINSSLINPAKGKKISDYDAFNQAIWKSYGGKTGKILSKEALQHLANLTGYAFSNKATSPFWQTLHKSGIKGFRRGSESIPYDMIANLGEDGTELQYDVSKGVLKSVGQNDMIFTAEQAKTLMDFAKNPMMFSNMYTGNAFRMPNMPVTNRTDNDINITIGDVNLEGVQNPQQFASSMKDAIKNNTGGVRNMIKDTTVGSLSPNHNSLGIRKY